MANEFKVKKGLIVQGSGSTLLDIQGSQGQLFSVTDSLSGSLFSVNDISGMPIMEVFSDDRVLLGTFNAEAIKVSGSTANITGSLFGTASWAVSASWAPATTTAATASFVTSSNVFGPNGSNSILSASYATTASYVGSLSANIANNINNYLLTATGGSTINGESSLQFDGTLLKSVGQFEQGSSDVDAVGTEAHAEGRGTIAEGNNSHAEGYATISTGTYSHAEGAETKAAGQSSHAEGYRTLASATYSHTEGYYTTASGIYSHAEGSGSRASGIASHAEGWRTVAAGTGSHAEGYLTSGSGIYSHAEGSYTTVSGQYSHAEGNSTVAQGDFSHAEGFGTITNGSGAHAEGLNTKASGSYSHAEGYYTTASGNYSHAEGAQTIASGQYSHAEGSNTVASGQGSHAEGVNTVASGLWSHAEGYFTSASGSYSHAEGNTTIAIGAQSHAEGGSTVAFGIGAHAEGSGTRAVGDASHAEGDYSHAGGRYSHAEGRNTSASGEFSHAEGEGAIALQTGSHAEGYYTVASGSYQHVQGQFNISSSAQSAFIIGNGTNVNSRSNLVFASGSILQVTGSVNATQGFTGSLFGTASWAANATSVGSISANIVDNTNNYILTATGGSTIQGESALTFNGSLLTATGNGENIRINSSDTNGSYMAWSNNTTAKGYIGSAYHLFAGPDNLPDNFGIRANNSLAISAGGSGVKMFVSSSGNVGIGKTNPATALDITGSAIITGSLRVSQGVTGSLQGTASYASQSLSASFATAASTIAITNDNATNTTYYPIFTTGTSGNLGARVDNATLTYNPGTNTLTTTTFAGNATTATTASNATNATNVTITSQDTTPITYNLTFTGGTSGNNSLAVDSTTLTYNPSTSTFTTPIVNSTTAVRGGNGSAAAPALSFSGDTDTGIYNYAANALGIATGGALRMYISSSGVSIESGIVYNSAVSTANVNGEIAYWGGGSVTAGNVYFYSSTGNWELADADAAVSSSGMLGIAQATGTAGSVGMLLRGHARFTGVTSFTGVTTIGAPLYVSQTAGAFTQTAPTGTGKVVRIIGYVQSTANDQIYFCPDTTWVELS